MLESQTPRNQEPEDSLAFATSLAVEALMTVLRADERSRWVQAMLDLQFERFGGAQIPVDQGTATRTRALEDYIVRLERASARIALRGADIARI